MLDNKFKKLRVGIIDLQVSNIHSVFHALKTLELSPKLITKNNKFSNFDLIVLPGVGSFKSGVASLKKNGFDEKIKNFVENKNRYLFGICLGMQLFLDESEEHGYCEGLGLVEGRVKLLKKNNQFNVPNIGWQKINFIKQKKNFNFNLFYFIHSYYCKLKYNQHMTSHFKVKEIKICSSLKKNNIFGTQFHPEKSGRQGLVYLNETLKSSVC